MSAEVSKALCVAAFIHSSFAEELDEFLYWFATLLGVSVKALP
jgi:hypothetical protein